MATAAARIVRSVIIDVKQPAGLDAFLTLVTQADVLLGGFQHHVAGDLAFLIRAGVTRGAPEMW